MFEQPELVSRIGDRDLPETDRLAAERELCLRLAPRIRLYALRHLRDEAAAADVVQEALIIFLRSARDGRIEDPGRVDRFVLGTCRNLVARIRRDERQARTYETAALPDRDVFPPAFTELDAARLALCLGKLALRDRQVVLLTFQEDRSADEIAEAIATSAGNVRVIRHRAMVALHRCVEVGPS
ncbi:MAG: RNA polymerase sigma factor [Kofleriaceae bacterium]